jgi:hypothetical protein
VLRKARGRPRGLPWSFLVSALPRTKKSPCPARADFAAQEGTPRLPLSPRSSRPTQREGGKRAGLPKANRPRGWHLGPSRAKSPFTPHAVTFPHAQRNGPPMPPLRSRRPGHHPRRNRTRTHLPLVFRPKSPDNFARRPPPPHLEIAPTRWKMPPLRMDRSPASTNRAGRVPPLLRSPQRSFRDWMRTLGPEDRLVSW